MMIRLTVDVPRIAKVFPQYSGPIRRTPLLLCGNAMTMMSGVLSIGLRWLQINPRLQFPTNGSQSLMCIEPPSFNLLNLPSMVRCSGNGPSTFSLCATFSGSITRCSIFSQPSIVTLSFVETLIEVQFSRSLGRIKFDRKTFTGSDARLT